MPRIFICYRRDDSAGHAGRLYDRLAEKFGRESVFMDVDTIEPGTDFVEAVDRYVGSCDVLLAIIGTHWQSGNRRRRRLHEASDFVRVELSTAIKRNIRLIPVLIQDANLPAPEQLPEDLAPLLRRQAFELRDSRWSQDCEHLITALERIPSAASASAPAIPSSDAAQSHVVTVSEPSHQEPRIVNGTPGAALLDHGKSANPAVPPASPKLQVSAPSTEPWLVPPWRRTLINIVGMGLVGFLANTLGDVRQSLHFAVAGACIGSITAHLALRRREPRPPLWETVASLLSAVAIAAVGTRIGAVLANAVADWADISSPRTMVLGIAAGSGFGFFAGTAIVHARFGQRSRIADGLIVAIGLAAAVGAAWIGTEARRNFSLTRPELLIPLAAIAALIYLLTIWANYRKVSIEPNR